MKKKNRIVKELSPTNPNHNNSNQPETSNDRSPYIPQRSKLKNDLHIFERFKFTDRQNEFIKLALDKNTKLIFVSGPAGTAKAQPLDSDILTPSGWKKMGEIYPGTLVAGEDGKFHTVISVHPQGEKEVYKVEFSDGTYTECTLDHLWETQTSNDRNQRSWTNTINGKRTRIWSLPKRGSIKTTSEIMNSLYIRNNTRVNHSIPITKPIELDEKSHFISSYLMGVLLGDGCFRTTGTVSFSSGDEYIVNRVMKEIPSGMKLSKHGNFDYYIRHINCIDSRGGNKLKNELIRLKLDGLYSQEKFIPAEYLFDCIKNRIDLLRGLMDTDGTVTSNGIEVSFTTTSEQLKDDIRFVVESLGGICRVTKHKTFYTYLNESLQGLDAYKVSICMTPDISPFSLPRKSKMTIPKTKYRPIRYITGISSIGKKKCQCILIDSPSHLYLTNNCIVTHNTLLSVYCALKLLNEKRVSDLIYVRSAVESSEVRLGALPGTIDEKISVYTQPLVDKLEELLPKNDIELLKKEERIVGMPTAFLRGLNWNAKVVIGDEFQNCTYKEIVTFVTRIGEFSKIFVLGDFEQSDLKNGNRGGFENIVNKFDDDESKEHGIYVFKFNENDIVRSKLLRFIVNKLNRMV